MERDEIVVKIIEKNITKREGIDMGTGSEFRPGEHGRAGGNDRPLTLDDGTGQKSSVWFSPFYGRRTITLLCFRWKVLRRKRRRGLLIPLFRVRGWTAELENIEDDDEYEIVADAFDEIAG